MATAISTTLTHTSTVLPHEISILKEPTGEVWHRDLEVLWLKAEVKWYPGPTDHTPISNTHTHTHTHVNFLPSKFPSVTSFQICLVELDCAVFHLTIHSGFQLQLTTCGCKVTGTQCQSYTTGSFRDRYWFYISQVIVTVVIFQMPCNNKHRQQL